MLSGCNLLENMTAETTPLFDGEPVVRLASPLPNEIYAQGAAVNILGRVENAGLDIAAVEILLNDQPIGRAETPNVSGAAAFTVTNSWPGTPGDHVITLRALRADGTSGEASVRITVQGDAVVELPPQPEPEMEPTSAEQPPLPTPVVPAQTQPTVPPSPTPAPTQAVAAPTQPPATNPPAAAQPPAGSAPTFSVISGANIRSGPGMMFDPPIASLPAGAVGTVVAISPDRQWYRITYNNGLGRGWINAAVVTTTGDLAGLPIDSGPATPAPQPPAAANPAQTAAPAANTDLSITFLATTPDPLVCNQQATITVIVVNTGSTPSAETTVLVQDLHNGQQQASATATVRPLGQNESVELNLPLTVSTFFLEQHTIRARVDPDNRVPETNEGNNEVTKNYTLAQGDC
jgi:hypothetical protein